jgi:hypothetical protein
MTSHNTKAESTAIAHTPGDWSYDDTLETVYSNDPRYCDKTAICKIDEQGSSKEEYANACLIAAAPELLEIAFKLQAAFTNESGQLMTNGECTKQISELITLVPATIAKATGMAA